MTDKQVADVAALLYYADVPHVKGSKSFEQIEDVERKRYIDKVVSLTVTLDKCQLAVLPKPVAIDPEARRTVFKNQLTAVLTELFKEVRVWRKELFPTGEVVAQAARVAEEVFCGTP